MLDILDIFWKVAVFILVIGVLVFVHELGHFIVAKICRVGVLRFSLGFGRALLKYRLAETTYQICWIPLGGYVRMVGDMPDMLTGEQETDAVVRDEEEDPDLKNAPSEVIQVVQDKSRWFINKGFWARSAIVVAGPLFNFLFAWFVFGLNGYIYGEYDVEEAPIIGRVMEESPAFQAGLEANDHVKKINGTIISKWKELAQITHNSKGQPLTFELQRNGITKAISIQPQAKELTTLSGKKTVYLVGIEPKVHRVPVSLSLAPVVGLRNAATLVARTYQVLWGMLSGAVSANDLAGPVFIFQAASKQAERGLESLLSFMALLSISLAVLNLLPIPVLDGGHLLFFIIEALIGPISTRKKEMAQQVGMLMLLFLMAFAIHNDVTREIPSDDGLEWDDSSAKVEETKQEKN
jgi:regulator of sigma E protease